jgi:hypothetical protein
MSSYADVMSKAFSDELKKLAHEKISNAGSAIGNAAKLLGNKYVLTAGGSAAAYEGLRRAERDRRLGRQVRKAHAGRR